MKKLYSTIMLLSMMVAALSLTACGGDDDEEDGGVFDDNEYCQYSINGETHNDKYFSGGIFANYEPKERNGIELHPYGGMTESIPISYQDDMMLHVIAGYTTSDMNTVYPKSTGTYEVVSSRGQYWFTDYSDRTGLVVSGGCMNKRTVTSGSLKITKTSKFKDSSLGIILDRNESYVTEGTFSFVLTDDLDGNENKIEGKFRIVF